MTQPIDRLIWDTGVNTAGWQKGVDDGERIIERMYDSVGNRFRSMPLPAPSFAQAAPGSGDAFGVKSADLDDLSNRMTSVVAGVAGQIRGAVGSAAGPIGDMMSGIAQRVEKLGPIIEKSFIRIDSAIKFPAFERRTESTISWIGRRFGRGGLEAGRAVSQGVEAGAAQLTPKSATLLDKAGAVLSAKAKAIGAKLSQGVVYGLEKSVHIPPSMTTAFIGANVRRRGAGGRFSGGNVTAPPKASPIVTNATGTTLATKAYEVLTRAVYGARWAEQSSWRVIERLRDKDAKDVQNLIGTWLNFQRVKDVLSSLGSVANATWKGLSKLEAPKISIDPRASITLRGIGMAASFATGHLKSMGIAAASALGVFSIPFQLVGFLKDGAIAASGLGESLGKTKAIMGDAAPAAIAYADQMAQKWGIANQATLDAASGFAALGKNIGGMSGKPVADLATELTHMSVELAAFSNGRTEDLAKGLRSFLVGNQVDSLEQLGFNGRQTALEKEARLQGKSTKIEDMAEEEKFLLRLAIARKAAADAKGVLEREGNGSASLFRRVTGSMVNLGASVGTSVLPAVNSAMQAITGIIVGVQGAFERSKGFFDDVVDRIASGFDFVAAAVTYPSASFEFLKIKGTEFIANIGEVFAVLGPNIVTTFGWVMDNWKQLLNDAFEFTKRGVAGLFGNINRAGTVIGDKIGSWWAGGEAVEEFEWKPVLAGFEATVSKFPELAKPHWADMSKDAEAALKPVWDDFARRQAERRKPPAPGDPNKGQDQKKDDEEDGKPKKGKDPKTFAGVAQKGTKEEYEARINAMYGIPRNPNSKMEELQRALIMAVKQNNKDAERRAREEKQKEKGKAI